MVTVTNRQHTIEFDLSYGRMRAYRCAIAYAFGVGKEYERATRWGVSLEESNYWVNIIEKKIPSSLFKFLFACDCNKSFRVKRCDELYYLLKNIKLTKELAFAITMYSQTFNLHKAFIEAFRIGRYKGVGVRWY